MDVEESKRVDIDVKFDFLDNDFLEDSPIGVIGDYFVIKHF